MHALVNLKFQVNFETLTLNFVCIFETPNENLNFQTKLQSDQFSRIRSYNIWTDFLFGDHSKFMRNTGPVKFDTGQTLFLRLYKRDTDLFYISQNGTKTF